MTSVTVVVTAYRRTRYLEAAIRTVLDQTDPPEEVVVVEDNPPYRPPSTGTVGSTTVRRFNLSLPNVGESLAFGIDHATGDVVCFLDDDDRFEPGKVARARRVFSEHPSVVFFRHAVSYIDGADRPIPPPLFPPRPFPDGAVAPSLSALSRAQISSHVSSMSIRRSAYAGQTELLRPIRASPDHALYWLSQLPRTRTAWYAPEPLVQYRRHPGNMSAHPDEVVRYAEAAHYMLAGSHGARDAGRFARGFDRSMRLRLAQVAGRRPTAGDVTVQLWDALVRLSPFHLRQWAVGLRESIRPGRRGAATPEPASGSTP